MSKSFGNTILVIDSGCDLPLKYVKQDNIVPLGLIFNYKGEAVEDDFGENFNLKDFYNALRQGEMPTTSQINSERFVEVFRKYVSEGKSIIYIVMSSALTGTINSANIARETILEEFPSADISIVDSKAASLGEGLLVYHAYEMLKKGSSKEEIVTWLEENKLKINHWFTVSDLNHLKRGGRISSSAAAVGTLLNIKPVLIVDNEGRLTPFSTSRLAMASTRAITSVKREALVLEHEEGLVAPGAQAVEQGAQRGRGGGEHAGGAAQDLLLDDLERTAGAGHGRHCLVEGHRHGRSPWVVGRPACRTRQVTER